MTLEFQSSEPKIDILKQLWCGMQAWKFHHLRETIYRYQNNYSAETTERSFVSMESNYQKRRGNNGNDLQDIQFFISSIRNVDLM